MIQNHSAGSGIKWKEKPEIRILKNYEENGRDPKDIEYLGENSRVIQFVINQTNKEIKGQ
jgi:hypothetical protein